MPAGLEILLDGSSDDCLVSRLTLLEIEENIDGPGSLSIQVPITRTEEGDLEPVDDPVWQPLTNIAVVVSPEEGPPGCVFDGYLLSHRIHLEDGLEDAWMEAYAQDATWLMNLEEKTREWVDGTDSNVASTICEEYGFRPDSGNFEDDSGTYSEDRHSLMQRGTDYDFLRTLARRAGRLFRVTCDAEAGDRIGVFARPDLSEEPVATFRPNDPEAPNVSRIEFEWDVMRPTAVAAHQALFSDRSPAEVNANAEGAGDEPLGDVNLSAFAGKEMKIRLTAPADDAGLLRRKADAVLRDAQWFVRCTGEVDMEAIRVLLRVGDIAAVEEVGAMHSGRYLIWSVRHRITQEAHVMDFVMVRNAVGAAAGGGSWE